MPSPKTRRPVREIFCWYVFLLPAGLIAQQYIIQPLAGGGGLPPIPTWDIASAAVDSHGNVLATLPDENIVIRLDTLGGVSLFAGNGAAGFSGDGDQAIRASLNLPTGIAIDPQDNVYVVDTFNHCVRKISHGIISTVAGNGAKGFGGDGGPATLAALNLPTFIAVDSAGDLFISDSGNFRVREVSGGIVHTVAGSGTPGDAGDGGSALDAQFFVLSGVAVDHAGRLYIADFGNGSVRVVSNGLIYTVAGTGVQGYNGDHLPGPSTELNDPLGLASDDSGALYIADSGNNRIRKLDNGVITTVAGGGPAAGLGDGGSATAAFLNGPASVAFDAAGNYFVADENHGSVREVSAGIITTVLGPDTPRFGGDGGPAINAALNQPASLAFDASGSLYVAESANNRIRKVTPDHQIATIAGGGAMTGEGVAALDADLAHLADTSGQPCNSDINLAVDSTGTLYFSELCRVFRVSNGQITTVAGGGTSLGDDGPATGAQLDSVGIAFDGAGNLYIADTLNQRIREVSNGKITTVAGDGTYVLNVPDNVPARRESLGGRLFGLAVNARGDIYMFLGSQQTVRRVSGGIITTVLGPAYAGSLDLDAIAVDSAGNVYGADVANQLIVKVTGGIVTTVAGNGVYGDLGDGGLATHAELGRPAGLAVDASGDVGIAEIGTNRVRLLIPVSGNQPALTISAIVNAASFAPGPILGGSLVTLFGNFGLDTPATATGSSLPASLSGLSVQFSGFDAGIYYASANQLDVQVPWEVLGRETLVSVTLNGQTGPVTPVTSAIIGSPGIFTMNGQGTGQAAVLDTSYRLVDASNPAGAGDVIQIFATGLGPVGMKFPDGDPAPMSPFYGTQYPVSATIGGIPAPVTFAGLAPGLVGGYQVNAQIPAGVTPGPAVPVVITLIDGTQSNTATIAVK